MIIQTPVYNVVSENCDNGMIVNRLKIIEESINSMIEATKINASKQTVPHIIRQHGSESYAPDMNGVPKLDANVIEAEMIKILQ